MPEIPFADSLRGDECVRRILGEGFLGNTNETKTFGRDFHDSLDVDGRALQSFRWLALPWRTLPLPAGWAAVFPASVFFAVALFPVVARVVSAAGVLTVVPILLAAPA